MGRFGPDPLQFFRAVYEDVAPWDVGAAQPGLEALFADFPLTSPVLDVGCGSGDLSIAIARHGHHVLGVDFVAAAIVEARQRAASCPRDVQERLEFVVSDALRPSRLNRKFGSVVDSGFYHLFERGECARFAEDLLGVLSPGGRYYLLAFAVEFSVPNVPRAVTETELREMFSDEKGWQLLAVRAADFQSRVGAVPAICACIQRAGE